MTEEPAEPKSKGAASRILVVAISIVLIVLGIYYIVKGAAII